MQPYIPVNIWWDILDHLEPTYHQPRSQLVRCIFDKILLVVALSLLAVGCALFAITSIAALPLYIGTVGIMLVSDAIAFSLENAYRTIKRWTSRMWCRILGSRKKLTTNQLPTTNTPVANLTPTSKDSPVSLLASSISVGTTIDEKKFALHSNPATTIKYVPSYPSPVFPFPCAEIRGRSSQRDFTSYSLSSSPSFI
ncbi:hypothetical protein EAE96_004900 [Botrytis aclada]|nr:hypothetical protein EAE96_004900 [Botrytis aclada]